MMRSDPNWLKFLSRHLPWLGIPHISIIFVTLQILGALLSFSDPIWIERMALIPNLVFTGEYWRLVTFLAVPLSQSPIWMIFSLLFLYSILNSIEAEWGEFKTSFYVFTSILLTIIYSLAFNYPVFHITDFTSTLFLAAAALFPELEIRIYMIFPIKIKYLGYLTLAFLLFHFIQGEWNDRFFLLAIYSNYFIFFGPSILSQMKDWKRRRDFKANWRR